MENVKENQNNLQHNITVEKAINTFKLAVCPKICMIKGPKSDEECIRRVDKCIKKDGGCRAYKLFVEKINKDEN